MFMTDLANLDESLDPAHSFQGLILRLQTFWAGQGTASPLAVPSCGAGNQVSSTVPSPVAETAVVASPWPQAAVMASG